MEASPSVIAKKMCKILRMVLFMIQKGVTKSKIMPDLHLLMKRSKILGRALNDIVVRHYTALTCRSNDMHAPEFVSSHRGEYEFSCSNSPAYQPYIPFHVSKRRGRRYPYSIGQDRRQAAGPPSDYEDDAAALEYCDVAEESPLVGPVKRRVRVTDSPFPLLGDDDVDSHVDKEAEEFIQRFYKQLRLQKSKAMSPQTRR
ncbi:hypothetical protein ACOSP7_008359 [Xanthoceras sorbifolium]